MKRISVVALAAALLLSGGAYAADLQIPATPDKAIADAVPSGWDGFYAGVNAGYGWGNRTGTSDITGGGPTVGAWDYNLSGGLLGAQAGFNYELTNNFVVGVQVDADFANINGSDATQVFGGGPGTYNWLGTATAKLGYATDKFLVYVDGGYAIAGFNFSGSTGCSFNQADSGFVAGVGGSYKMTDNISVDLNYNHVWFQDATAACSAFGGALPLDIHDSLGADVVKVGLNYKFGG
jgi:outer membrane immunogenic protein